MDLLILLLPLVLMWLLLVRPQQQRLRAQRALVASLTVGDRVVTAAGFLGRITRLEDDIATVELAPGIEVQLLRPFITRRIDADGPVPGSGGFLGGGSGGQR